MLDLVSYFFGWFALTRGSPSLIHGDLDRRDRSTIHSHKTDEVTVGIGNCDDGGLLHLQSFFNDELDSPLGLRVVNCVDCSHRGKDTTVCQEEFPGAINPTLPAAGTLHAKWPIRTRKTSRKPCFPAREQALQSQKLSFNPN